MVTRKRLAWAELKVGVFVIIALTLLIVFILRASWGSKLFSFAPKQFYAKTYLPTVERLKPGSPVWLSGLEVGYVTNVRFVPVEKYSRNQTVLAEIQKIRAQIEGLDRARPDYWKKRSDLSDDIRNKKLELRTVEIMMKIDNLFRDKLGTDSEVSIGSAGLIGESYIDISIGSGGEPARREFDPTHKQEVVIVEGLRTTSIKDILAGANDVVANFSVISDQMKRIANRIDIDQVSETITTVGSRLDSTFKEAETAMNRANQLIQDVQSGKGTMGKIMQDSAIYDQAENVMRNVTDITERVKSGRGTAGRFIVDEALYNDADRVVKRADVIAERIEKGQGTIGMLSKDRALYDQTTKAIEKLTDLADRIERGEGTLGKLSKDDSMYKTVNQTLSEVSKLIYDFRQNPKRYLTINFKLF
ncbi:MAG: MCE family protein [Acidobacteria bacterium]|nr:MCE family protein [Acidobacteriota bacterium]MBI3655261.1 MCE family protein [Acidobacteriota bacterium]